MKDTGRLIEATVGDFKGLVYEFTQVQIECDPVKLPVKYMTTIEVAYLLEISTAEVQMLTRYGYLISYNFGSKTMYKKHEVENMNLTADVIKNIRKLKH